MSVCLQSLPTAHHRCIAAVKRPRKVLPSREEVCQRGAARTVCHAVLTQIVSAPGSLAPAPKMSNKKLEEKYERASKPPPSPPSPAASRSAAQIQARFQQHTLPQLHPPLTSASPSSTKTPTPILVHPDPERTGTTRSSRITSGSQRTAAASTATAAATSTSSSTSTPSSAPHARAW